MSGGARRCKCSGGHAHTLALLIVLSVVGASHPAAADEVEIVFVRLQRIATGSWTVHTTLRHDDAGWSHYADRWRVVDADGNELGVRELAHPHDDEQPFTRSLRGVRIADDQTLVYIEARDSVHGWAAERLPVDLRLEAGERYEFER